MLATLLGAHVTWDYSVILITLQPIEYGVDHI